MSNIVANIGMRKLGNGPELANVSAPVAIGLLLKRNFLVVH